MKKNTGITLVALVITIIILLILAGVAISMITGGEGLFAQANGAATKYNQAAKNEADLLNQLLNGNYLNNGGNGKVEGPAISSESHVGYYADLNPNDGKIDGIIFADLAVGNTGSGEWKDVGSMQGNPYTIPVESDLKDYYISQESYTVEGFGTKPVISPKKDSTGAERFYIMALEDFSTADGSNEFAWYAAASEDGGKMSDHKEATSSEFGTGKSNTSAMIAKWNLGENGGYGKQDCNEQFGYKDMWGVIQEEVSKGWFVPSMHEWGAFFGELGIVDLSDYGLNGRNWSSSQTGTSQAWGCPIFLDRISIYE